MLRKCVFLISQTRLMFNQHVQHPCFDESFSKSFVKVSDKSRRLRLVFAFIKIYYDNVPAATFKLIAKKLKNNPKRNQSRTIIKNFVQSQEWEYRQKQFSSCQHKELQQKSLSTDTEANWDSRVKSHE